MTHQELLEIYSLDSRANTPSLLEYKEARRYYHGSQLPDEVLEKLNLRGQPPIVENIYKMIVNKILGYKIQSLQEVKVSGRQEQDKPLANLFNDLLKVFTQSKQYDKQIILRDKELILGLAVCEVWVEQDKYGDNFIELKSIPADCFIIDAFSRDQNALDSRRFHRRIDMDIEEARAIFGQEVYIENHSFVDSRTSVIETWVRESPASAWSEQVWSRYYWHERAGIYQYEHKPFKNGMHPFVIAKYQIDEKNRWYGLFRDIKPLQDFINFAENRAVNMLGSFKALFEDDAVLDTEEFVESVGLDNAVIKVRSGALKENKIQFIKHNAEIQALSQKTEHKRSLAKILSGLNDEALGMAVNRQSGVAIAQRRDAGLLGLQDFIKIGDDMDKLICEKAIDLMQQYFTQAQVFKIIDQKTQERYIEINTTEQNTLKAGKFDLIFKTTLKQDGREERFAHWVEMMKTIQASRPELVPELLPLMLKDVDSPIIQDIEALMQAHAKAQEEQAQAHAPLEQARQDLALAQAQAQLEELQAKANKYNAQASVQEASAQVLQAEANALESTPHKGEQNESKALNHAQKLMQFNPKKAAADMR